jgi:opacity protein-like surface antigen
MKKTALLTFIFTALAINTFAVDISLSAGGGTLLGYTFTRYDLEGGSTASSQHMDRFDYGVFLFFDATYAEFSVMYKGGSSTYNEKMVSGDVSLSSGRGRGSESNFVISLHGKYPLTVNEKMTWFPMLGIEYQITLTQRRQPYGDFVYDRSKGHLVEDRDKNDNPYPLSAWNSFWINVGAGLDYNLSDSLFLRGEFLFGFRLQTDYERGALEVVKKQFGISNPKLSGLTGSPQLKVAIGYRL